MLDTTLLRRDQYPEFLSLLSDSSEADFLETMRDLCRTDLWFLLRYVLRREDMETQTANPDWLLDRCREIRANPDGYLDLWAREHYKDLANTTPILTTNGWKLHGDLRPGDCVFSPIGLPVRVLAVTQQYHDSECYRVRFQGGDEIVSGAGHLWRIWQKHRCRVVGSEQRVTRWTSDVVPTHMLDVSRRCDVGAAAPIQFPEADLPIPPYTMGAWLGDGSSAAGIITTAYDDIEIIDRIRSEGVTAEERRSSNAATGLFRLDNGTRGKKGAGMTSRLRRAGVLNNKHIPEEYLRASAEQRMELLRGLMDTDGHCSKKGQATFVNTNLRLALGVHELATALALRPRFMACHSSYQGVGYVHYRVTFQAHRDRNPFHLARKAARAIAPSKHRDVRNVVSVERVPSVPTRCIQVEGGMYLAGSGLIPTHNSTIITFALTIQDILRGYGEDPVDDPEPTFGIFSHTRPQAKAFLRQIRNELTYNASLKEWFPDILYANPEREALRWGDEGFIVRRRSNPKEATVEAWGLVDGQPTGMHYGVMIYDDVVTLGGVSSPEMMRKTTEAWEMSLNLGAGENVRRRMIGTRYHFMDTWGELLKRRAAIPRIYAATDDGTITGEPVLRSREFLEGRWRDMGSYVFNSQMMQNPVADNTQGFQRTWFKHFENPSQSSHMNRYLLADPANAKRKKSDWTVAVVLGLGPDENIYLLDAVRDRLNLTERAQLMMRLHRQWRPKAVGYEEYGLQADIEYLREVQAGENYRFDVTPVGGRMSKEDRIRRLVPYAEQGRFYMPATLHYTQYDGRTVDLINVLIEEEFMGFPVSLHDDFMDAISRVFDLDMVWPKIPIAKKADRYAQKDRRSWMSG